jgi:hypothetical protein
MAGETLRIEQMQLRVPGFSAAEGRGLGQQVVHRVAGGLSDQVRPQQLGALDLRVTAPPGTPGDRLATSIAEAILKGLV